MGTEALTILFTSMGAILVATVGAILGAAVSARAKVDEGLREQRLPVYPQLWAYTAVASRWPRTTLTWQDLAGAHARLRQWYYGSGGMFMSERSRDLYGDVQELLDRLVAHREQSIDQITNREYEYLMETCSSLRTALTQDLETRRYKPTWNLRRRYGRRRWYLARKAAARNCIGVARAEAAQREGHEGVPINR